MHSKTISASLTRRLVALLYDAILLLGLLFAVSAFVVALVKGATNHPLYFLLLLVTTFVFYGWFWTHGGQTLGMRTWKIKIIAHNDSELSWKQAAIRFVAATAALLPAGLGLIWLLASFDELDFNNRTFVSHFAIAILALLPATLGLIWMLISPERLTWFDKWSATRVISLKKIKTDATTV